MRPGDVPDSNLIRFALHGGAGELAASAGPQDAQRTALRGIAESALACLHAGGSAVDAVSLAVEQLERCPLFNAGVGAVLNRDGLPELDAAIARGEDRGCGAVAAVSRVASPILLARAVMERTPHVLVAGTGAECLAGELGLALVEPAHFIIPLRRAQLAAAQASGSIALDHVDDDAAFGTVGAVARDARGHLAAATSTGGLSNKLPGRIGDSAVFGAGTFADDASLAVSCTGTGEAFIRAVFGHAVHARLLAGERLAPACEAVLAELRRYGGSGGCIAISRRGELALPFSTGVMYRAWSDEQGRIRVAIRRDDEVQSA
jgi:beta-aspartyl-peptidase (threonine type)